MKKLLVLLVILFAGCGAFATVVTQRRVNPENSVSKENLANNIKMCKPYSESMQYDFMGMNFSYNLQIKGWINNKCRLDFDAKAQGASSSFSSLYGIDANDATILSFAPKIRCEFTKQQLEYVGDSILQEEERNGGATNNMLKNPNKLDISTFQNMSDSDQRLMDVVMGQGACTILNMSDLDNVMKNLR